MIMQLLHRKSRWQRLIDPLTDGATKRGAVKSGLVTIGTMVGVTIASAVVSALRDSEKDT
jgi:hypothetical protein